MLDDELIIETPERVELHYVLANVGNRFLAAAIDHLIQLAVVAIFLVAVQAMTSWQAISGASVWVKAIAVLIVFAIIWGYFVAFETLWNGQTPGKRIMKLRVIREDGRPVRFFEAFIRNLLRLTVDFQPIPSYAVGVVSIIFNSRSKRVGDFVAGTVVVKERATEAPSLEEIIRISEAERRRVETAAPFAIDARLLTPQEVQVIETFLKRRFELPPANRAALASRIASSAAAKLNVSAALLPPESLLEEVERQHAAQSRYFD
jgi:uncharacterized RDD family membrane protein YckC